MAFQRISASTYSNTAPLIWSFLYGSMRGKYEMILDNAPARSADLVSQNRVDAALVPVITYQTLEDVFLVPDVCVGAKEKVRSVCLITKGKELQDVKSVSLDASSKTSVALTKIIFREFLGFEPKWINSQPNLDEMLSESDCALLIGDPSLSLNSELRVFDLVELWQGFTGFGFVFAMWMTINDSCEIDFVKARDEGLQYLNEIISSYKDEINLSYDEFKKYLTNNISYSIDDSMKKGLDLYFELAAKNHLIKEAKPLKFCHPFLKL